MQEFTSEHNTTSEQKQPAKQPDDDRAQIEHLKHELGRDAPAAAALNGHRTLGDHALQRLNEGWAVIKVPYKRKVPNGKNWQETRRLTREEAAQLAGKKFNLGVLTGAAGHGLYDVDCDHPLAVDAANVLLPATARVHGRRSNPRRHRWYLCPDAPDMPTVKFSFTFEHESEVTMLCELRGGNAQSASQTIIPPSVYPEDNRHPQPELAVWADEGEIAHVTYAELRRRVAYAAVCVLVALHWPGEGSRDVCAMAFAGALLRAQVPADDANTIICTAARLAGDEEYADRDKAVATLEKLAAGKKTTGWPKLAETLIDGQSVCATLRDWLGVADQQPQQQQQGPARLHLLRGSDIVETPVLWAWPDYLPAAKASLLDGMPDLGKSTVTLDLAARWTTGRAMPDGQRSEFDGPVDVIIASCEDDPADTIVPRLRVAGADVSRVHLLTYVLQADGTHHPFSIPQDMPLLAEQVRETGARVVIVDPLVGYLDGSVRTHVDHDVRRALACLHELAQETGVAVLCIRHFRKAGDQNMMLRGAGSVGIIGAMRGALAVLPDPDRTSRRRYLGVTKHNLSAGAAPVLAYEIEGIEDVIGGVSRSISKVEWRGGESRTLDDLASEAQQDESARASEADAETKRGAMHECYSFVENMFADGEWHKSTDVEAAIETAGHSNATWKRCRKRWTDTGKLKLRKRDSQKGSDGIIIPAYWEMQVQMPVSSASRTDGGIDLSAVV